jgi:hypothetical protein
VRWRIPAGCHRHCHHITTPACLRRLRKSARVVGKRRVTRTRGDLIRRNGVRPFGQSSVSSSKNHCIQRGVYTLFPPEILHLIHKQWYQERLQEAAMEGLARAARHVSAHDEGVYERLFQWIGSQFVSWGCALQRRSLSTRSAEKGCCACP